VMVTTPTPRQRRAAGAPETIGVIIDSVEKGSPGDDRLQGGDMVLSIDEKFVHDGDDFVRVVGAASVQHPTKLVIRRDGSTINMNIMLRQRELPSVAVSRAKQRIRWRGMLLGPIPANWDPADQQKQQPPQEQQATFKPDHGLMVLGIDSDNAFYKQGIRSGAVITSVAGRTVTSVSELQSIINETPPELCNIECTPLAKQQAVASGQ
jgi:S1-C subfamily serine protease